MHRETEGAPYTGLKPAGSTKKIILLSDEAIENENIDDLLGKLNNHIGKVILEKYEKVIALDKVKNDSSEKGREYVEAYVDYTHTIEAIHSIIENGNGHSLHIHWLDEETVDSLVYKSSPLLMGKIYHLFYKNKCQI